LNNENLTNGERQQVTALLNNESLTRDLKETIISANNPFESIELDSQFESKFQYVNKLKSDNVSINSCYSNSKDYNYRRPGRQELTNTDAKSECTLQPLVSTEFEQWSSLNSLLNAEGFQPLPIRNSDRGVHVLPDKLSELVIALVKRAKQFEKKLATVEMTNFNLANQLREVKTNRFEDKIEKLTQELNSKSNTINANKLQHEKESSMFKSTVKQLNNEINELKSSKDIATKNIKIKENEINELKVRMKGI